MDPINIFVGINLIYSLFANASGAKKGFKKKISGIVEKPQTYLQKVPPNISALILVLIVLGIFGIGTLKASQSNAEMIWRIAGLLIFVAFSILEVQAFKTLGKFYTQDIAVLKGQNLVISGYYKIIRHPQYLFQILSDIGAGVALQSYLVIFAAVLLEIPLFILRAKKEEELLEKHFGGNYKIYKQNSSFFLPFI